MQGLTSDQYQREWDLIRRLSCQVAASIDSDWVTNHPAAKQLQLNDGRTSRFVQLALIAAHEAMVHSELDQWLDIPSNDVTSPDETIQQRRESYGVCIGNGMSSTRDISTTSHLLNNQQTDPSTAHRRVSPHFVPRILPNSPSARVAIQNQLLGPNLTHSEACAAGACAISHGVELIQSGRAKGMVVGGCESAVEALGLIGFSRLRALSSSGVERDDASYSNSRPFDESRDGFVLSEGAAMMVLEEHDYAISRGANILAEVVGIGYSGDGYHITAPEPDGKGAARAMLNATSDAGVDFHNVDYINAHATSTPVGDLAEMKAIRLALDQSSMAINTTQPLYVSSTKGAMGHLLGASGAIEAAMAVSSVANQLIPHTHNLDNISDDIKQILSDKGDTNCNTTKSKRQIHLVQHKPMAENMNFAMSNSFGFGGTNVSLLISRYKT